MRVQLLASSPSDPLPTSGSYFYLKVVHDECPQEICTSLAAGLCRLDGSLSRRLGPGRSDTCLSRCTSNIRCPRGWSDGFGIGRRAICYNSRRPRNHDHAGHNDYYDGSPDDDGADHNNDHHDGGSDNNDGAYNHCLLHDGYQQHEGDLSGGPQPGGREHHDRSAAYHHGQAKRCQHGCSAVGRNAGLRALPRPPVIRWTEEGARPLLLEAEYILGHRLTPVAIVSDHPAARVEILGGNPPWSTRADQRALHRKAGPNITCERKGRGTGGGGGSRNGATTESTVPPHDEGHHAQPSSARVCTTSRGDEDVLHTTGATFGLSFSGACRHWPTATRVI
ncbi:uncharacterized protein LOC142586198 [Dermacentor variabilis]|uniref:uncharacterized protein LOC142586198 n=1 Tax=Dermacentor variabilis TaxID=34621 RepID=UPI003F5C5C34